MWRAMAGDANRLRLKMTAWPGGMLAVGRSSFLLAYDVGRVHFIHALLGVHKCERFWVATRRSLLFNLFVQSSPASPRRTHISASPRQ